MISKPIKYEEADRDVVIPEEKPIVVKTRSGEKDITGTAARDAGVFRKLPLRG